jgi:hypothetical protein
VNGRMFHDAKRGTEVTWERKRQRTKESVLIVETGGHAGPRADQPATRHEADTPVRQSRIGASLLERVQAVCRRHPRSTVATAILGVITRILRRRE